MAAKLGAALKSTRNGHASGICSITVNQLKHGSKIVVNWLTHIMNYALSQNPCQRNGVKVWWYLYGKAKLIPMTANHRCITLLSIPDKVFTCVLLNRLHQYMRTTHHWQQAGLMPNGLTMNQISAIWLLLRGTENSGNITTCTSPLLTLRQYSTQLIDLYCSSSCGWLACHTW